MHRTGRRGGAVTLGVVAVGAAVALGGTTLGQSGLLTDDRRGHGHGGGKPPRGRLGGRDALPGAVKTAARTTRAATSAEEVGVVDITTVLNYGEAAAAGTGIVLTPSGEILTNNHVVDGATKITVTVVSTGTSYSASVVGTDPTDDVAVLQLVRRLRPHHGEARRRGTRGHGRRRGDRGRQRGRHRRHPDRRDRHGRRRSDQRITASDETGARPRAAHRPDRGQRRHRRPATPAARSTRRRHRDRHRHRRLLRPGGADRGRLRDPDRDGRRRSPTGSSPARTARRSSRARPAFLGVQLPDGADGATIAGGSSRAPPPRPGPARRRHDHRRRRHRHRPRRRSARRAGRHQPRDQVTITWTDAPARAHRDRHPRHRPGRLGGR